MFLPVTADTRGRLLPAFDQVVCICLRLFSKSEAAPRAAWTGPMRARTPKLLRTYLSDLCWYDLEKAEPSEGTLSYPGRPSYPEGRAFQEGRASSEV